MKLSAPTVLLFLISLVLAIVAVVAQLSPGLLPPQIEVNRFWIMLGAYGVLTLGVLFKGL